MAEQENCARMTRAAKKRAAAAIAQLQGPTKKRVALAELTNLSVVPKKPELQNEKGSVINRNARKIVTPAKPLVVDAKVDDPQLCGPYVSDIDEYLREMEVGGSSSFLSPFYIVFFFFLNEFFLVRVDGRVLLLGILTGMVKVVIVKLCCY